jgi:hypothetical protein
MSSSSGTAAVPAAEPPVPQPEAVVLAAAPAAGSDVGAQAPELPAEAPGVRAASLDVPAQAPAPVKAAEAVPTRPPGRGSWLLEELAALSRPVVMPIVRRLPTVIFVLCALLTTICVATVLGAVRDDVAISRHPVVTTAEVLPGSGFSRTLIRFTTSDGKLLVPERGVYYPRGLLEGQFILVQYDATHPDRVRVLGRNASMGLLPVGLMLIGVWVVLLPLGWWLRRRRLRRNEASA